MKKIAVLLLCIALLSACASAQTVYVTISDGQGQLVLAHEGYEVSDQDEDGVISIADALYIAHESAYPDGAAGFAAAQSDYGLSMAKLWGEENGGSYGYYVNHAAAASLSDAVQDGDHVQAFVYTDLTNWSDAYCYFDADTIDAAAGESVQIKLNLQSFDENWNPVAIAAEGAEILIDGEASGLFTDSEGAAAIKLDTAGAHLISAKSDGMTLVPPVCIVNVK